MKQTFSFCIAICLSVFFCSATPRDSSKTVKVAIFTPLYIDSAFDGASYKLGNNFLPKNMIAGLDFYNGVMLAIDSLKTEGTNLEVQIYDTKSKTETLSKILLKPELQNASLMIAAFNNRTEIKPLADFAKQKQIPLLSATFPNDGGVTDNPYFLLVNSTLRTHCEGIYKYLQKYHATGNLVFFTRKGPVEKMVMSIFSDMSVNTPAIPLKYKTVELTDSFTYKQMVSYLDSTKQNIVICGTPNEAFGLRMVKGLVTYKNYPSVAIGMPTWDGIKDISKPGSVEGKGLEIVYSSPYYFNRSDKAYISFLKKYQSKFFAKPNDWALKGFESMYHFSKLLLKHGSYFLGNLNDKEFRVFNEFDFDVVETSDPSKLAPDYLENKKLYFIKKQDGAVKGVY